MPVPHIDKDITVKALRKKFKRPLLLAPYFLKSIAFNKDEYGDYEAKKKFANRITKNQGGHGNFLRMFAFGVYEAKTVRHVHFPFKQGKKGRFILNKINPEWKECFVSTISLFIERGWTVCVDLLEHSQLHNRVLSHWGLHPWNRKNSRRFYVPELDGKHHLHYDVRSVHGHWREWDSVDKGWSEPPYNYKSERDMTKEDYEDMNMNRATREAFLWWIDYILNLMNKEFGKEYWVGHNEWPCGAEFHNLMADLYKEYGVKKNRRLTSFLYGDWYQSKKMVFIKYYGSVHGCYYWDAIEEALEELLPSPYKFMFSQDGGYWGKHGKNYKKLKETVKYSLTHGLGFEINNDYWIKRKPPIYYAAGRTMRTALNEWLQENG